MSLIFYVNKYGLKPNFSDFFIYIFKLDLCFYWLSKMYTDFRQLMIKLMLNLLQFFVMFHENWQLKRKMSHLFTSNWVWKGVLHWPGEWKYDHFCGISSIPQGNYKYPPPGILPHYSNKTMIILSLLFRYRVARNARSSNVLT